MRLPIISLLLFLLLFCHYSVEAQDRKTQSLQNFLGALEQRRKGFDILESPTSQECKGQLCSMNGADWTKAMGHLDAALSKANNVDVNDLESFYLGWGTNFDRKFREGLRMMHSAQKDGGQSSWVQGQQLLNEWAIWYNANAAEIKRSQ